MTDPALEDHHVPRVDADEDVDGKHLGDVDPPPASDQAVEELYADINLNGRDDDARAADRHDAEASEHADRNSDEHYHRRDKPSRSDRRRKTGKVSNFIVLRFVWCCFSNEGALAGRTAGSIMCRPFHTWALLILTESYIPISK